MGTIKAAWALYKDHLVMGTLILGVITVPVGAVNGLIGAIFGPFSGVGNAITGLLSLLQMIATTIGAAAVGRWVLGLMLGRPVGANQAWRATIAQAVPTFLSLLVAFIITGIGTVFLIVPGILVGAFVIPVFLIEGKSFVDLNMRTLELTKTNIGKVLLVFVALLVCAIAVGIPFGIASAVLGFVPFLGPIVVGALGGLLSAVAAPFFAIIVMRLYFEIRGAAENIDVEAEARNRLGVLLPESGTQSQSAAPPPMQ